MVLEQGAAGDEHHAVQQKLQRAHLLMLVAPEGKFHLDPRMGADTAKGILIKYHIVADYRTSIQLGKCYALSPKEGMLPPGGKQHFLL